MPLIRKPAGASREQAPDAATIAANLRAGGEEERWTAARMASRLPNAVELLSNALGSEKTPRVREAMFTALATIATPAAAEAVLPFVRSDDAHVRTEALDALAAMKAVVWPYLPALLRDPDSDVRILACELARSMPADEAARLFTSVLESEPQPNVCAAIVEVLAEVGGAEVLPALERCRERFRATPFLAFAIGTAAERIRAQSSGTRA